MKYAVVSDVHLGHLKTPTKHIIANFKKYILNDQNKDLDVLFIAGDLFDRLLDLNSEEVHIIVEFFSYLVKYCSVHNIALRVLEGTPSHDWQQSKLLEKVNDIHPNSCNFKYVNTVYIEYIEKIAKYVLYIPDEWASTHEKLQKDIEQELVKYNISSVDIVIAHGQFYYQTVGKNYHGFYFEESYFLNLCKGFIHVGHYHTHTHFDRIVAQGSFDRLAHSEEEDKGYVVVQDNTWLFITNKDSYIYKSIPINKNTTLAKLDAIISKLPKGSYIRFVYSSSDESLINYQDLKLRYSEYYTKKHLKTQSENSTVSYIVNTEIEEFNSVSVEKDILSVIYNNIVQNNNLQHSQKELLQQFLYEFSQT